MAGRLARMIGIARRAFDVAIEPRRREARALLVAFELGHVDAIGREAAERVTQGARLVLQLVDRLQVLPVFREYERELVRIS